jgi:hypothetical protein
MRALFLSCVEYCSEMALRTSASAWKWPFCHSASWASTTALIKSSRRCWMEFLSALPQTTLSRPRSQTSSFCGVFLLEFLFELPLALAVAMARQVSRRSWLLAWMSSSVRHSLPFSACGKSTWDGMGRIRTLGAKDTDRSRRALRRLTFEAIDVLVLVVGEEISEDPATLAPHASAARLAIFISERS